MTSSTPHDAHAPWAPWRSRESRWQRVHHRGATAAIAIGSAPTSRPSTPRSSRRR